MGFDPHDVRHVTLIHFDADHTGGLADFPWAQVHLTAAENFAALHPNAWDEKRTNRGPHQARPKNTLRKTLIPT